MRVTFKNMLLAYVGKIDGLIYYYNPRLNRMVVRQYVKPRESAPNRRLAAHRPRHPHQGRDLRGRPILPQRQTRGRSGVLVRGM